MDDRLSTFIDEADAYAQCEPRATPHTSLIFPPRKMKRTGMTSIH